MPLRRVSIANTSWETDPSGLNVLHVYEPHALVQAAGYLKFTYAENYSEGIYFRGQRKIYGSLTPTLFRGIRSQSSQCKRISSLKSVVSSYNSNLSIFRKFGAYAHEPLLQHYGVNTSWIDVVDNVWVALWFACHRAKSTGRRSEFLHFEKRIVGDDCQYAYIILIGADIASRNAHCAGLFYGDSTELIDLRMSIPSVFLRPHAQHGLLFRVKGIPGAGRPLDYTRQIRGVLRIKLGHAIQWLGDGKMVGVHSLFPPPYYDHGYRILLSANILGAVETGAINHIGA